MRVDVYRLICGRCCFDWEVELEEGRLELPPLEQLLTAECPMCGHEGVQAVSIIEKGRDASDTAGADVRSEQP